MDFQKKLPRLLLRIYIVKKEVIFTSPQWAPLLCTPSLSPCARFLNKKKNGNRRSERANSLRLRNEEKWFTLLLSSNMPTVFRSLTQHLLVYLLASAIFAFRESKVLKERSKWWTKLTRSLEEVNGWLEEGRDALATCFLRKLSDYFTVERGSEEDR